MKVNLQKQATFIEAEPGGRHHANYSPFNEPYCLVRETAVKQIITQISI